MARYGKQTLTVKMNDADRENVTVVLAPPWPNVLHRCDGLAFVYDGKYDEWSWDGEDTWHYANFCPRCGVDLRALIPKE